MCRDQSPHVTLMLEILKLYSNTDQTRDVTEDNTEESRDNCHSVAAVSRYINVMFPPILFAVLLKIIRKILIRNIEIPRSDLLRKFGNFKIRSRWS